MTIVKRAEMLELPWQNIEEGVRRLMVMGILEWISYVTPKNLPLDCVPQEDPGDTLFLQKLSIIHFFS